MKNTINNIFGAGLNNRVSIYVPGTAGPASTDPALAEKITAEVAGELSALFGGATISLAAGAWVSADYGLIREDVQIVYSNCTDERLEQYASEVRRIAEHVKSVMEQEAVSVEINGVLYFI